MSGALPSSVSSPAIPPAAMTPNSSRPPTALREDAASPRLNGSARPIATSGQPVVQDFQDQQRPQTTASQTSVDPPQAVMSSSFEMDSDGEADGAEPQEPGSHGIHIPTRTTSIEGSKRNFSRPKSREPGPSIPSSNSLPTTPESHQQQSAGKSSADSVLSYETNASSVGTLPPLQIKGAADESDRLEPLMEDDPRNFDLIAPAEYESREYSLEKRAEQILSQEHLQAIFADPALLNKFTSFLSGNRPQSIPILIYYLDALKALRAINYANAVAEALEPIDGMEFTRHPARPTLNSVLEDKASRAFEQLARDDLPAYVSHVWVQVASLSIQMRITGTQPPHLREASEGLAETFCLTDPSRKDNPIIFASEEFHRTTQYGVSYAIGRNCRFLQGPRTNPFTVERLGKAIREGKEISELILNYRRDGSAFLNLLMMAPLMDNKGKVRYFIGSQVDVSGLAKDCTDLPALKRMLAKDGEWPSTDDNEDDEQNTEEKDEFQELCAMFNQTEIETVRKLGGRMHREQVDDVDDSNSTYHRPRLLLKDPSPPLTAHSETFGKVSSNGKLAGIYQHYLLVRPHPSLRILFTSPSLRVPGILQSPFMSRIGGSSRVRDELEHAMAVGRGVTAKIRWLSSSRDEGRSRWIHCTPLLGQNGSVGVWMVVLVDDHGGIPASSKRLRVAPPVSKDIGVRRYEDHQGLPANRSELRSPEPRNPSRAAMARNAPIGRTSDTHAANKFDRQLTDDEFDRQIEERERLGPVSPRSPMRFGERVGNMSPYPGSGSNSLDSFKI